MPVHAVPSAHVEHHFVNRAGWLRAAVLGANDGIVSTASLIIGVAAATPDRSVILIAAAAGMIAGAMSMAAGEYVSVSSQSDIERADLLREHANIITDHAGEHEELAQLYMERGVSAATARDVAAQLMDHDALDAHARDELGISPGTTARPLQAAWTSGASFITGAAIPLLTVLIASPAWRVPAVAMASLALLALLGALGARVGGAPAGPAVLRVAFWGTLAMVATAAIGRLVGTTL